MFSKAHNTDTRQPTSLPHCRKNIKNIQRDLLTLEPHDRLRIIIQMAEFAIPKMQRIEIRENHEGNQGKRIKIC